MEPLEFFTENRSAAQKQYDALRDFYLGGKTAKQAAQGAGLTEPYFKKIKYQFQCALKRGETDIFFKTVKTGPKKRFTSEDMVQTIIDLRKKNHSVPDIKSILDSKGKFLSLQTIDKILKAEGFAPLPRRTRTERKTLLLPENFQPPETKAYCITDEELHTETGAGVLLFLPLLEKRGIIRIIEEVGFPETKVISAVSSILSFLALKLLGRQRYSHDENWKFDRALGLFANLNVLPKNATLSSYSYRVNRDINKKFLQKIANIFDQEDGEFNLDFKSIPHWGDKSILEKNWSGSRQRVMKSILALMVQSPKSGYMSYTDSEIKHSTESGAILDFVDFWTHSTGKGPKMLIFDSKLTSYENLNKLNESQINFLTLRRRGNSLVKKSYLIPENQWKRIKIEGANRKHKWIKVHDSYCKLRNYKGEVRQIIITDHGREKPTFLITNDFGLSTKELVKKYARRWLVELEIAEQIDFFQLNHPSSSIVVKVDFDLTLSLLAHNLYRDLAKELPGFESCTASTLSQRFIDNGARINICGNVVNVYLKKKTHLPLLFNIPMFNQETKLQWHGFNIVFSTHTVS